MFIYMKMNMAFTTALGPLNRWGLPARTNTSVTNSRAVSRRASHGTYDTLFLLEQQKNPKSTSASAPAPASAPPSTQTEETSNTVVIPTPIIFGEGEAENES